jgi:hypothetical protein
MAPILHCHGDLCCNDHREERYVNADDDDDEGKHGRCDNVDDPLAAKMNDLVVDDVVDWNILLVVGRNVKVDTCREKPLWGNVGIDRGRAFRIINKEDDDDEDKEEEVKVRNVHGIANTTLFILNAGC